MYLEYHYVIAVILLSALIAGLLVRWRYKKIVKSAQSMTEQWMEKQNKIRDEIQALCTDLNDSLGVSGIQEWGLPKVADIRNLFDKYVRATNERIESLSATLDEQGAVLEKAQAYNAQSESQVRHFQKTASTLKEDLATVTQERDNGVRINEDRKQKSLNSTRSTMTVA